MEHFLYFFVIFLSDGNLGDGIRLSTEATHAIIAYNTNRRRVANQIGSCDPGLLVEQVAGAPGVIAADNAVIEQDHGLALEFLRHAGQQMQILAD